MFVCLFVFCMFVWVCVVPRRIQTLCQVACIVMLVEVIGVVTTYAFIFSLFVCVFVGAYAVLSPGPFYKF